MNQQILSQDEVDALLQGITGESQKLEQEEHAAGAIRNNILMALAEKTAAQLMDREGKAKLAEQIKRETARAMGIEVEEPEEADADSEKPKKPGKKKKGKKAEAELPITAVHFSNFIIQ